MGRKKEWGASWINQDEEDEEKQSFLGISDGPLGASGEYVSSRPESISDSKRVRFLILILVTLFIAESSRGMVVATLYLYLSDLGADRWFVGIVVAAFSVGRMIGGFVFGWQYNHRGAKEALVIAIIMSIVGNFMFSVGQDKFVILAARFITGFGTGILSVVRACIAATTTSEDRSKYFAWSGAVQFLGFALVPGVSIILTFVNFNIGPLNFNQFNSAGYILVIASIINLIFIMILFVDIPPGLDSDSGAAVKPTKRYYFGVGLFIFLNFVARGIIALLETVGAPVFLDIWPEDEAVDAIHQSFDSSMMFLVLGACGLVVFIIIPYVLKLVSEKNVLLFGFISIGAGAITMIQYSMSSISLVQFFAGASLIWSVGSPIVQTIVISAFSKMLGSKPQGVMMAWIAAAGSLGRIVFPLIATVAPHNVNFIVGGSCSILAALLLLFFRSK